MLRGKDKCLVTYGRDRDNDTEIQRERQREVEEIKLGKGNNEFR